jgi:hypothetical protein
MGYPMTWQRFVNRNRLKEGDYDGTKDGSIAGDLRRLESDSLDSGEVCEAIAADTGLDKASIIAVLKKWFAI